MKKTLIVAVIVFCLLLLGFLASAPKATASPRAKWDQLMEAAKKEGKVMIYGRGDPAVRKELSKAFSDKYGIDLEFLYFARGGEMTAKVKKERSAGLYLPDVIIHGATTMVNLLKPADILDPMDPVLILPEVTDNPKVWRMVDLFADKAHMITSLRATFMRYSVRNTNLVKEGELTSYQDLLDTKWKGKMVMYDPTRPGTGSGFVSFLYGIWGQDKTVEFLRQLVKQTPVITRQSRVPMEGVARGKYAIGIAMRNEVLPEFLKLGVPVALVKMIEGGQLSAGAGCLAVVNKRPHPNAAALFANWILSKDGMAVWSKGDGHPSARLDVSTEWVPPIFLAEPGEKVWIDDEAGLKRRRAIMKRNKKIFAPLLK